MVQLLLIDAATSSCRVGVVDEQGLRSERTVGESFKHAEKLTLLIDECMQQAQLGYDQLAAVVITGGPGSYTGLRIGASVAKGICFAHQLPMIALNTLEVMARGYALTNQVGSDDNLLVPMLDARRMEAFTAAFSTIGNVVMEPQALVLDEQSYAGLVGQHLHFFGDGAAKFEPLFKGSGSFDSGMYLGIEAMRQLALRDFEMRKFVDIAYYRPDYHKDFYSPAANK